VYVFVPETAKGVIVATVIGEVDVDLTEGISRRPLYIRLRYKHVRRVRLALWLLTVACHTARWLGVAVYVTTNEWVRMERKGEGMDNGLSWEALRYMRGWTERGANVLDAPIDREPDAALVSPATLTWLGGEWAAGRCLHIQAMPLMIYFGLEDGVLVPAYWLNDHWEGLVTIKLADYAPAGQEPEQPA
jgi:hypothetical protein